MPGKINPYFKEEKKEIIERAGFHDLESWLRKRLSDPEKSIRIIAEEIDVSVFTINRWKVLLNIQNATPRGGDTRKWARAQA